MKEGGLRLYSLPVAMPRVMVLCLPDIDEDELARYWFYFV